MQPLCVLTAPSLSHFLTHPAQQPPTSAAGCMHGLHFLISFSTRHEATPPSPPAACQSIEVDSPQRTCMVICIISFLSLHRALSIARDASSVHIESHPPLTSPHEPERVAPLFRWPAVRATSEAHSDVRTMPDTRPRPRTLLVHAGSALSLADLAQHCSHAHDGHLLLSRPLAQTADPQSASSDLPPPSARVAMCTARPVK